MRKSRFSEEQIVRVLKEAEAGVPVAELTRREGISDVTFYRWKAKYGGMEVNDARRLRELEDENRPITGGRSSLHKNLCTKPDVGYNQHCLTE